MVHLNAYMERVLVGSSESLGCAIGVQPSQATRKDLLFEIPCEFAVSRGRENLLENDPMCGAAIKVLISALYGHHGTST